MKQSSSRVIRNRGWKVKHVLQICILATVCIWLIYQVKHSHDRKTLSDDLLSNSSDDVEEGKSKVENLKLGRKDPLEKTLHLPTEVSKELEEAEDSSEHERENNDDSGDDIDEIDHERSENEEEDGEGEEKEPDLLETEDTDEKSQEAREENYKADDVSSAVSKDEEELAQEFVEQKHIKGQNESEDGGITNHTASISQEVRHDHGESSSPDVGGLEIGPLPNSTVKIVSSGSIVDQNNTSSAVSHLVKEVSSNSSVGKPNDETLLGNSTISELGNWTDIGHPVGSEHVNQTDLVNATASDHGKLTSFSDSVALVDNSSRLVSAGNDSQSTETQKSQTETVSVSIPVIEQKDTSKDEGLNDYDTLDRLMESPTSSDSVENKDQGSLTEGRATE